MIDLIAVPLLVYASATVYARLRSERMMFLPQPPSYETLPGMVTLTATDGTELRALYLPHEQATQTILFSHGNAEDLGDVLPWLDYLRNLGFSVLSYDYRGYGQSRGTPSEKGSKLDAEAVYDYATGTLAIPPEAIIAYGFSIGGGPAVHLAANRVVGGLVLQSSFVSAYRVMTRWPLLPFDRFPIAATLRDVTCPVLVIHGRQDQVIPFWHGHMLYEKANGPKYHLWLDDAGHNDIPGTRVADFVQALTEFANSLQQGNSPPN